MAARGLRIPYPTVVAFERALEGLSDARRGDPLGRDELLALGLAPNAASPVLEALRFLGLAGADGRARGDLAVFRAAPAAAIRAAIGPILALLDPPYPNRRALAEALGGRVEMTPTTIPLAATFLVWLAERAGIELVRRLGAKPGARPGVARADRGAPRRRPARAAALPEVPVAPAPAGPPALSFQLLVDRRTTREDLERMMREVEDALARHGRS